MYIYNWTNKMINASTFLTASSFVPVAVFSTAHSPIAPPLTLQLHTLLWTLHHPTMAFNAASRSVNLRGVLLVDCLPARLCTLKSVIDNLLPVDLIAVQDSLYQYQVLTVFVSQSTS
jgi:hypothetical protein